MNIVIKRDGRREKYNSAKVFNAVNKACLSVGMGVPTANSISEEVVNFLRLNTNIHEVPVNDIHALVEYYLARYYFSVGKAYMLYREKRSNIRETKDVLMDSIAEISIETSKENANTEPSSATKMYQIASVANKKYVLSRLLKKEHADAHIEGDIHIHDLDYYQHTVNCMTHDTGRMLKKGFYNGSGFIRPPKRIGSACALIAIILQSMQNNMFGGQAVGFFDTDLATYAKAEYDKKLNFYAHKLPKKLKDKVVIKGDTVEFLTMLEQMAYDETEEAVGQAMEALIYNLNTMRARSGNQVPFTSLNFGTDTTIFGRMVTKQLLLAYKKGLGNGESPLFPNLCFRVKSGINLNPNDPNYDLFQLALECASIRMNPTFANMDSSFNAPYGLEAGYMGCRTRVLGNIHGEEGINNKGNLFFTTINLPRIALKSKSGNYMYSLEYIYHLDKVIDLVIDQLIERYNVVKRLKVKDLPFVMDGNYLNSENLSPDDCIEPAIKNGSLAIGFIGLAETLRAIYDHDPIYISGGNQEVGRFIIAHMRKRVDQATKDYGLNFSLIATPAEGLSGRFLQIDKKQFGEIEGVTDKEHYTNSFHVPVALKCSISEKIQAEAPYHALCNGGHISYVELSAPPKDNILGLERIIKYMFEKDMGYVGINFPIDFCNGCHYTGVIDEDYCPSCGDKSIKRIRRITGYLSEENRFNDGKLDELNSRVSHDGKVELC